MTVLTPANAFPNLAFPQHGSGQTQVISFTYPGAVWPKATGPAVLSWLNAFPGATNLARSFNGSSDQINTVNNFSIASSGGFTWAAWINLSGGAGAIRCLWRNLAGGDNSTSDIGAYINSSTNKFVALYPNGGLATDSTFTPTIGTWCHLAITTTFGVNFTFQYYANGATAGTSTFVGNIVASASKLKFGSDAFSQPYPGSIADFAMWNIALSGAQVANLASGTRANAIGANANLTGYWPMGYSGSYGEADFSGNGNNGILTGTSLVPDPIALGAPSRIAFPQHLTGQTLTVQNFLYPGAVQPQAVLIAHFAIQYRYSQAINFTD